MSVNKTSIIISREYSERVKKKSFIITTILVPVLMLALSVLPTLIIVFAGGGETKTVAVIDDSGLILQNLTDNEEVRYIAAEGTQEELLSADEIYGLLVIDRNIVKRPSGVKLLTPNASSLAVENNITSQMEKIIETEKLKSYDIDNLDQILDNVKTSVTLQTLRTDENGEEGESQSAAISSAIGTLLNFLLYMFLVLYGSLVMNSIIEEKKQPCAGNCGLIHQTYTATDRQSYRCGPCRRDPDHYLGGHSVVYHHHDLAGSHACRHNERGHRTQRRQHGHKQLLDRSGHGHSARHVHQRRLCA